VPEGALVGQPVKLMSSTQTVGIALASLCSMIPCRFILDRFQQKNAASLLYPAGTEGGGSAIRSTPHIDRVRRTAITRAEPHAHGQRDAAIDAKARFFFLDFPVPGRVGDGVADGPV
jgi:hypothetical protein